MWRNSKIRELGVFTSRTNRLIDVRHISQKKEKNCDFMNGRSARVNDTSVQAANINGDMQSTESESLSFDS